MLHTAPTINRSDFEAQTGWAFKPEGACKGDVCVPLDFTPGETLTLDTVAEALGMPLVADIDHNLWALGPESLNARALTQAAAPPLKLPALDGKPFDLTSLRGKKVVIYAWAPY